MLRHLYAHNIFYKIDAAEKIILPPFKYELLILSWVPFQNNWSVAVLLFNFLEKNGQIF
jgi:hypothetical protein